MSTPPSHRPSTFHHRVGTKTAAVLALVLLTLAAYWPALHCDFQYYHDDEHYITSNDHVSGGLTGPAILWAFTSVHAYNWHPLTWLSHMLDCQFYGLNPAGHHLTSVLLHIANALLLLLLLRCMTEQFWLSALVAALFALHPLHVESVAWISERKDVLSTFFGLLTLCAYVRYVEQSKVTGGPATHPGSRFTFRVSRFYLLSLCLFACSLMSKAMLVTFPFVLLLLDYWPLNRFQTTKVPLRSAPFSLHPPSFILLEKLPFLILALAASVATYLVQQRSGAVQSLDTYSVSLRLATAIMAYAEYVLKTFWPANLAALYPHPAAGWAASKVVAGAALLMAASAVAFRSRRPYLLVGWLWYLGTLLPVIGLVQVGSQAYADRYTYLPVIGLFIALAWSLGQWATTPRSGSAPSLRAVVRENSTLPRRLAAVLAAAALLLALTVCTRLQARYWKDSPTLFEHAIQVVDSNYLAEHELGMGLARDGRLSEALVHLRKAAAANPGWVQARYNLACLLYFQGDYAQAADELTEALQRGFRPQNPGVLKLVHAIQQAAGR